MEAVTARCERRCRRARTGAPHWASIAFIPTARTTVLFPAMLGPLMIMSRNSPPSFRSFRTARLSDIKG
jgi:hypothetical protein